MFYENIHFKNMKNKELKKKIENILSFARCVLTIFFVLENKKMFSRRATKQPPILHDQTPFFPLDTKCYCVTFLVWINHNNFTCKKSWNCIWIYNPYNLFLCIHYKRTMTRKLEFLLCYSTDYGIKVLISNK